MPMNKNSNPDFFLPDLCNQQSFLFLVLLAELLVIVLVLASEGLLEFGWAQLALTSLFVQWVVLSSAGVLCTIRPWLLQQESLVVSVSLGYGMIMLVALVFSFMAEWLLLVPGEEWGSQQWGILGRNMIITLIMAGLAFRYFYLAHQLRRKEQAELNSRIQALQSRIRPHFLFNSMNIITSLISVDPETAELVVEDLSTLFRASLTEASGEAVTLEEELQLCDKYIHIESLRLDDRLEVNWRVNVDTREVTIPLLSLQPLIENAIYHGIQPLPEGGAVDIGIEAIEDMIHITIENPVPEASPRLDGVRKDGNQMALENIKSRLSVMYGERASLSTRLDGNRFRVEIIYPK
ncbi:MAG: histidine kinase [Gammaproteobacteria bacterium]|nr:histidine kinase [Gammaproteobacteria bacterium]